MANKSNSIAQQAATGPTRLYLQRDPVIGIYKSKHEQEWKFYKAETIGATPSIIVINTSTTFCIRAKSPKALNHCMNWIQVCGRNTTNDIAEFEITDHCQAGATWIAPVAFTVRIAINSPSRLQEWALQASMRTPTSHQANKLSLWANQQSAFIL